MKNYADNFCVVEKENQMNHIKQIKLSKDEFIVEGEGTSLKLPYRNVNKKFIVDISEMNLLNATKIAILCSTFCFINGFKKKICWLVKDEEIRRAIGILRLRNMEPVVKLSTDERIMAAS